MGHDIRKRIRRPAGPEERERHQRIRKEIEQELPELKEWARASAAQHNEQVHWPKGQIL